MTAYSNSNSDSLQQKDKQSTDENDKHFVPDNSVQSDKLNASKETFDPRNALTTLQNLANGVKSSNPESPIKITDQTPNTNNGPVSTTNINPNDNSRSAPVQVTPNATDSLLRNIPAGFTIASSNSWQTFKKLDAFPQTSELDVQFIQDLPQCFLLQSDKTKPFNNQNIQPFQVGNTRITNNNEFNQFISTATSNNTECDQYAYYQLCNSLVSGNSTCRGKPLCKDDCQSLNGHLRDCGFPTQECYDISDCVPLVPVENSSALHIEWWVIFLIILAILLPCFICLFAMCKKKKRVLALHSISSKGSWGADSLGYKDEEEIPDARFANTAPIRNSNNAFDLNAAPMVSVTDLGSSSNNVSDFYMQPYSNTSTLEDQSKIVPPVIISSKTSLEDARFENDIAYAKKDSFADISKDQEIAGAAVFGLAGVAALSRSSNSTKESDEKIANIPKSYIPRPNAELSAHNANKSEQIYANNTTLPVLVANPNKLEESDVLESTAAFTEQSFAAEHKNDAVATVNSSSALVEAPVFPDAVDEPENANATKITTTATTTLKRATKTYRKVSKRVVTSNIHQTATNESTPASLAYKASFGGSSQDNSVIEFEEDPEVPATLFKPSTYHEIVDLLIQLPNDAQKFKIIIRELDNGQYSLIYDGTISGIDVNICQISYFFEKRQNLFFELIDLNTGSTFAEQCALSTLLIHGQSWTWLDDIFNVKAVKAIRELGNISFELNLISTSLKSNTLTIYNQEQILIEVTSVANTALFAFELPEMSIDTVLKFEFSVAGFAIISVNDLLHSNMKSIPIIGNGTIEFVKVQPIQQYTLLQYLQSGLKLRFSVGIDFTSSNKTPQQPDSLHYIGSTTNLSSKLTEYEKAMKYVGDIIESYGSGNDELLAYGFGADIKIGNKYKTSHDFQISEKPIHNIEDLLKVYRSTLRKIKLGRPTNFAPHLKHIGKLSRQSKGEYWVHLIITDGQVSDFTETVEELLNCSNYAMNVIILGVGHENFDKMHTLNAEHGTLQSSRNERKANRDVCDFYEIKEGMSSEILASIPYKVLSYAEMKKLTPEQLHNLKK